jgi:type VI secretion system secreted protein VgrG
MSNAIDMMSTNRTIDLVTPLPRGEMVVEKIRGTETLGRVFEYDLTVLSKNGNINFDDVLGCHVTALVQLEDGSRRAIDGRVAQIGLVDIAGNYYRYRLVLRPWLWMLSLTTDCRVFQEKSVREIIEEVFADHPDADFEFTLTGEYATRTYCVQYRESDLAFVSRLMEEEGLYYFFRHKEGRHTAVICDGPSAHSSVGRVAYMPQQRSGSSGTQNIRAWSVTREIRPGKTVLRDYDFERPSVDTTVALELRRPHADATYEVYDYPGDYVELKVGDHLVRSRLDELQASHEVVEGRGNSHLLATGRTFTFADFGRKDQNDDFLVVSTTIEASNNLLESSRQSPETVYDVSFRLIRASEQYRSPRTTPRATVLGLQTAVVVGPPGETIFTDKYGRVKVQFHWDRYGKRDDKSSCWILVSQTRGGKGWGDMFIPHVGHEVIVQFLEGNPSRPIVTGRVYNAEQMPPVALPAGKTQTILRDHGANEMRMEGIDGKQRITIYSPHSETTFSIGDVIPT